MCYFSKTEGPAVSVHFQAKILHGLAQRDQVWVSSGSDTEVNDPLLWRNPVLTPPHSRPLATGNSTEKLTGCAGKIRPAAAQRRQLCEVRTPGGHVRGRSRSPVPNACRRLCHLGCEPGTCTLGTPSPASARTQKSSATRGSEKGSENSAFLPCKWPLVVRRRGLGGNYIVQTCGRTVMQP